MRKLNSSHHINEQKITENCPVTATMLAIGGRWKVIILWHLAGDARRYSELKKVIPHISEKMLTQQLKELAASGWVVKKDFQKIPPHTEYSLSALGRSFIPVLEHIYTWGMANEIIKTND